MHWKSLLCKFFQYKGTIQIIIAYLQSAIGCSIKNMGQKEPRVDSIIKLLIRTSSVSNDFQYCRIGGRDCIYIELRSS